MFWLCQNTDLFLQRLTKTWTSLYLTFFFVFLSKSILSDTKTRTAFIAEVQIPSKLNVLTNCLCLTSFSVCWKTIVTWCLNNHNLLVLSVLDGISVWHLWILRNFSGWKVDGDIALKQPYTFVCVFSPKPLKLQAKLFCHFIAFSSPHDWSIKPTTCLL